MRGVRLKFMLALYTHSTRVYAGVFKANKQAWGISKEDFLSFPQGSLGYGLGCFYQEKGFDVMPKLENHDVFHLITATGTHIQDEIAMQFLLLGNGKISLYLLAMLLIGGLLFPEYAGYYWRSFQKGKRMWTFHQLEFKDCLNYPLADLQRTFENKLQLHLIK